MRRFNFRTIAAACLGFLLVACKGTEEDARRYLQEGKVLLDQGNTEQARVQFQNALQIQPKLAEAYYSLALIDQKKENWKGMYANLLEAVRVDPKHVQAHLKLGQLYLAARQLDKASEEASLMQKNDPEYVDAMTLRAGILFLQGKKAEGLEEVSRALERDSTNLDAIGLRASIYSSEGRYSEALADLNRGIEKNPEDIGLQVKKISVEAASKDFDAAVNDYRALISQHPDKKELSYGFVDLLSGIGRVEQAETVMREIVAKYPADFGAKLKLIDFLERRDVGEAEKTLKQFTEAQPAEIPLHSRLAEFYWNRKRFPEARAALNHIVDLDKTGREGLSAKVKLARIAIAENDSKTAESLVDQVLTADSANSEALMLRAGFRLARNESDAAISDLRIILRDHPNADAALVMLAQAYLQKNAPEIGESHFRKALEINPGSLAAALPVASKMVERHDLNGAEEVIDKAVKSNPANPAALQLLIQIRVLRKDWAGAEATVAELRKLPGGSAAADLMTGVILASQANFNEAIKKYQQALLEKPDFPEAIRGVAQAYNALGNRARLIEYLKGLIEKNPKVIEAYQVLGLSYAAEKKWDDAVKVLQNALKVDPKSATIYKTLADVYSAQNKPGDAVQAYREGLAEMPDSAPLLMALAQHYLGAKDVESAIAVYADLVKRNPANDVGANNLASLLADYRSDNESLQQASKLSERFSASPNPIFLDTYGWVALQSGNKDKAVSALKQVVAAAPEVAAFRYHLGMAYYQLSDKTAAKKELESALSLAGKQGEFIGMQRAKELVKELSETSAGTKAE